MSPGPLTGAPAGRQAKGPVDLSPSRLAKRQRLANPTVGLGDTEKQNWPRLPAGWARNRACPGGQAGAGRFALGKSAKKGQALC